MKTTTVAFFSIFYIKSQNIQHRNFKNKNDIGNGFCMFIHNSRNFIIWNDLNSNTKKIE